MLYHGTHNVESVLREGLKIKGLCIYLTDKTEIAKKYGDVLQIQEADTDKTSQISDNEILLWNDIKPHRIKLWKKN